MVNWTSQSLKKEEAFGKVWLIGTGPGDPDLLTVKAARILQLCTVWLVDHLVGPRILDLAPPGTHLLSVGKRARSPSSTPQSAILDLMAFHAGRGAQVARLKGGDPFIFGRGGEELFWLKKHGIAVEVLSGITSGIAAAASQGIPLTYRGVARGVLFVTAHDLTGSHQKWVALAQSGFTLVCYMGTQDIQSLVETFMRAGLPPTCPVAIVQNVSRPEEKSLFSTLQNLHTDFLTSKLGSPAIIVLGEAVQESWACS